MRQLTPGELEALTDAAFDAFQDYRKALGLEETPIAYRWSHQLSTSVGNVIWKDGQFSIKLSFPIIKGVLLREGWKAAEKAIKETMAHELAHVMPGGRECRGHDAEWARRVRLLGYEAQVIHDYTCGPALFGADGFNVGDSVKFQYKGEYWNGTIVKMNPRKAIVELPDGTRFRVPYSLLE